MKKGEQFVETLSGQLEQLGNAFRQVYNVNSKLTFADMVNLLCPPTVIMVSSDRIGFMQANTTLTGDTLFFEQGGWYQVVDLQTLVSLDDFKDKKFKYYLNLNVSGSAKVGIKWDDESDDITKYYLVKTGDNKLVIPYPSTEYLFRLFVHPMQGISVCPHKCYIAKSAVGGGSN